MSTSLAAFLAARTQVDWAPVPLERPVPATSLPTPALVVDVATMERNLATMQRHLDGFGVGLRAHAKMHKCPVVAHRQLELGAIGICTAKVAEAEVMRAAGIQRILITSPITDAGRMARVAELAARSEDVRVVVDDAEAATALAAAARSRGAHLGVLVDLDPAMGRTGIARGQPALDLVRHVRTLDGLSFTGLQQYAGQLMHVGDYDERRRRAAETLEAGLETRRLVEADGHEVAVFTGGGTGTFDLDCEHGGLTDLQAGSYVFMDEEYAAIGHGESDRFEVFEPALFVLVSVISRPRAGLVTVDGGLKAFASETVRPVARNMPGVRYHFGGDEHGILQLADVRPELGERVWMVTPHCDPTVNLYDWIYPVVEGEVHEIWPVAARGCGW